MTAYDAMMPSVRTTVTIDDQLLDEAKVIAARTRRSVSSVLEDALRELVARHQHARRSQPLADLPTDGTGGLRAGVDLMDREQIAELLRDNVRAS